MEIFNNYYAKIQFQKDVHFAKNIWVTFQYFDVFLHIQDIFLQTALLAKKKNPFNLEGHFSMILVLGLILVKPAVLAKESNH